VTEREVRVWNRAAVEAGGVSPRDGDKALAAVLEAHGLVMNGGVVHAVECLGPERLSRCCAGYVYFGLAEIAALLEAAANTDETDETEAAFIKSYWTRAKDDSAISERFERDIRQHPDRYDT
jgi:hypothetical protein